MTQASEKRTSASVLCERSLYLIEGQIEYPEHQEHSAVSEHRQSQSH